MIFATNLNSSCPGKLLYLTKVNDAESNEDIFKLEKICS